MSFRVEPEAIKAVAARYQVDADHLAATRDYNITHSDMEWYETGFIVGFNSLHNDFAELLKERLAQAADLLAASSEHLRKAADAYSHTDEGAAARLDNSYPAVTRPDANQWRGR